MDDIVKRLRQYSAATCSPCDIWSGCGYGESCDCTCHVHPCHEAADEIEQLRAELDHHVNSIVERDAAISQLRAAGDALHDAIRNHDLTEAHIKAWEKARRG